MQWNLTLHLPLQSVHKSFIALKLNKSLDAADIKYTPGSQTFTPDKIRHFQSIWKCLYLVL